MAVLLGTGAIAVAIILSGCQDPEHSDQVDMSFLGRSEERVLRECPIITRETRPVYLPGYEDENSGLGLDLKLGCKALICGREHKNPKWKIVGVGHRTPPPVVCDPNTHADHCGHCVKCNPGEANTCGVDKLRLCRPRRNRRGVWEGKWRCANPKNKNQNMQEYCSASDDNKQCDVWGNVHANLGQAKCAGMKESHLHPAIPGTNGECGNCFACSDEVSWVCGADVLDRKPGPLGPGKGMVTYKNSCHATCLGVEEKKLQLGKCPDDGEYNCGCSDEPVPVCWQGKTYRNKCHAQCSGLDNEAYSIGMCKNECIAGEEYKPVCGDNGKTYKNPSEAKCDGLTKDDFIRGQCQDNCNCPKIFMPVCGKNDGVTYENMCFAGCAGVQHTVGECKCEHCDQAPQHPVCGVEDATTYNSQCLAECAGAQKIEEGECPPCNCPNLLIPVCGKDGFTYKNRCFAEQCAKVEVEANGQCVDSPLPGSPVSLPSNCPCSDVKSIVCGKENNVNYLNPCVAETCAGKGHGVAFTTGECAESTPTLPSQPESECVVDMHKGGSNHKLVVTKDCDGGEKEYYAPYKKEACFYAAESLPDKIGTEMTYVKTEGTCYRTIFVDDSLCKTAHPDNVVIQGAGARSRVRKHFCEIIVVLP